LDEIKGLTAGGKFDQNLIGKDVGKIAARGIVLANLPGSLENLKFVFEDEIKHPFSNEFN
jgi:hypothetical protein